MPDTSVSTDTTPVLCTLSPGITDLPAAMGGALSARTPPVLRRLAALEKASPLLIAAETQVRNRLRTAHAREDSTREGRQCGSATEIAEHMRGTVGEATRALSRSPSRARPWGAGGGGGRGGRG
eukprot:3171751-Rhodomonas_salina.2